jgi:membrane peptidoglycan carboxypeptidase
VIGAWVGNNDNSPMEKKVAGLIVSPLWRDLMDEVLPDLPAESFVPPQEDYPSKPILRGEIAGEPHSILYYVDKDNPRGPLPSNPSIDPQFNNWEYGVRRWSIAASQPAIQTQPQVQQYIITYPEQNIPNGFAPVPPPGF